MFLQITSIKKSTSTLPENLSSTNVATNQNPQEFDVEGCISAHVLLKNTPHVLVKDTPHEQYVCANYLNPYSCKRCPKFKNQCLEALKLHYRKGHAGGNFSDSYNRCRRCNFVTYSKYLLLRHKMFEKCVIDKSSYPRCKFCNYQARYGLVLERHIQKQHQGLKKCQHCAFTTKSQEKLVIHIRRNHVIYSCEFCDYKTLYPLQLKWHITRQHKKTDEDQTRQERSLNLCSLNDESQLSSSKIHVLKEHISNDQVPQNHSLNGSDQIEKTSFSTHGLNDNVRVNDHKENHTVEEGIENIEVITNHSVIDDSQQVDLNIDDSSEYDQFEQEFCLNIPDQQMYTNEHQTEENQNQNLHGLDEHIDNIAEEHLRLNISNPNQNKDREQAPIKDNQNLGLLELHELREGNTIQEQSSLNMPDQSNDREYHQMEENQALSQYRKVQIEENQNLNEHALNKRKNGQIESNINVITLDLSEQREHQQIAESLSLNLCVLNESTDKNQLEKSSSDVVALKRRKQHQGIQKCQHCAFRTESQEKLAIHIHRNHILCSCEFCNYKTPFPLHLKWHVMQQHKKKGKDRTRQERSLNLYGLNGSSKIQNLNERTLNKRKNDQIESSDVVVLKQRRQGPVPICPKYDKSALSVVNFIVIQPRPPENTSSSVNDNMQTSEDPPPLIWNHSGTDPAPHTELTMHIKKLCKKTVSKKTPKPISPPQHLTFQLRSQSPTPQVLKLSFRCKFCSFQTESAERLDLHVSLHKDINVDFRCDFCSFQTTKKGSLKRHISNVHIGNRNGQFGCKHCAFRTNFKTTLPQHEETHESQPEDTTEWLECEHCTYKFKDKNVLCKHVESCVKVTCESFICEFCSYRTKYGVYLEKHVLENHQEESSIVPEECVEID